MAEFSYTFLIKNTESELRAKLSDTKSFYLFIKIKYLNYTVEFMLHYSVKQVNRYATMLYTMNHIFITDMDHHLQRAYFYSLVLNDIQYYIDNIFKSRNFNLRN